MVKWFLLFWNSCCNKKRVSLCQSTLAQRNSSEVIGSKKKMRRSHFNLPRCSLKMSAIRGKIKACAASRWHLDAFGGDCRYYVATCGNAAGKLTAINETRTDCAADTSCLPGVSFQDLRICASERHATLSQPEGWMQWRLMIIDGDCSLFTVDLCWLGWFFDKAIATVGRWGVFFALQSPPSMKPMAISAIDPLFRTSGEEGFFLRSEEDQKMNSWKSSRKWLSNSSTLYNVIYGSYM